MIVEPRRDVTGQPRQRLELLERRLTQRVERSEGTEQPLASRWSETFDALQGRGDHRLAALRAVKRDGEAVGLVADSLHQVQALRSAFERDGHGTARPVEKLLALGQCGELNESRQVE